MPENYFKKTLNAEGAETAEEEKHFPDAAGPK
jgi:hypothetical protein